uniref:Uncharacterized protein n=1 Tax=Hyaloperonospora arabidopsidis (strain Emoy2) TaxID=559515 RepID=M4B9I1_HYAAE
MGRFIDPSSEPDPLPLALALALVVPMTLEVRRSRKSDVSSSSLSSLAFEMSNILASAGSSTTAAWTLANSSATVAFSLPLVLRSDKAVADVIIRVWMRRASVARRTPSTETRLILGKHLWPGLWKCVGAFVCFIALSVSPVIYCHGEGGRRLLADESSQSVTYSVVRRRLLLLLVVGNSSVP